MARHRHYGARRRHLGRARAHRRRVPAILHPVADGDDAPVGVCDTRDSGGSLVIANAPGGVGRFLLPSAGRIWRAPRRQPSALLFKAAIVGDLYRLPPVNGADWEGIARIRIDVLPSTGAPP